MESKHEIYEPLELGNKYDIRLWDPTKYMLAYQSTASIIQILITLLTFILPFLVVYRSTGLWIRETHYRAQPNITFKKELIFVMHLGSDQSYVTYSTFPNYNSLQQQFLRIPLIKAIEEDITGDGLSDSLKLNLEIPLFDSEQVMGIDMLLFFTYELNKFSPFYMDCMAFIQYSSAIAGAKLQVLGNLQIRQRQMLAHSGTDRRYDVPIVDSSSIFSDSYDLSHILEQYNQRNVTTELVPPYISWIVGRGAGKPFIISATIKYPEDDFVYDPGFLYQLKWGWVQYVSVLVLFIILSDKLKIFLYSNRLLNTIVSSPFKSHGLKSS